MAMKPKAGIVALIPVIIYGVVELVKVIAGLVKPSEPPKDHDKKE